MEYFQSGPTDIYGIDFDLFKSPPVSAPGSPSLTLMDTEIS